MNPYDFPKLLRFFLGCVEAEDRRSLRKQVSSLHHSLVSVWDQDEPLFHPEAAEILLEVSKVSDQKVLDGGAGKALGPDRFFYGYPVFLDDEGFLSPLFVAEVQIERRGAGRYALRWDGAGEIQLNHHLFRDRDAPAEKLRAIQDELQREFGSFADRLRAAFELLGTSAPAFPADRLDPYPLAGTSRDCWINRPILFLSERSLYTLHLRRELEQLANRPQLLADLARTALAPLLGLSGAPAKGNPAAPVALLPVLPLNQGQETAARAGLEAPLTVVTGPPGTGKSQVVVDLLASCAAAGRPVLFASKNNKAVDVVRERLREILGEERDFTLRLGRGEIMTKSRGEMTARLQSPGLAQPPAPPEPKLLFELENAIGEVRRRIEILKSAGLEFEDWERDRRFAEGLVPPPWVEAWPAEGVVAPDPARAEGLVVLAERLAGKRPLGFWLKLRRLLAAKGLGRQVRRELDSLAAGLPEPILAEVRAVQQSSGNELWEQAAAVGRQLGSLGCWQAATVRAARALAGIAEMEPADALGRRLDELQARRATLAGDQLRAAWTGRIGPRAAAIKSAVSQYFDLAEWVHKASGRSYYDGLRQFTGAISALGKDLPVWIVTNLSTRRAVPLEPALFDLVIIDEASQCDIPSALPLLFRARRALIIGDPRQLRHISTLGQREEEEQAVTNQVGHLIPGWSYNDRSLYNLSEEVVVGQGAQPIFLDEHFRSHPAIIEFSNQEFYAGRLVLRTPLERLGKKLGDQPLGLFWHDVRGAVPPSAKSAFNEMEAAAVADLIGRWLADGWIKREGLSLGIVTPFRRQMEQIEAAIRERPWWAQVQERLVIGTAHQFQGHECDVMIFSPVVAPGIDPHRARWVAETDQLLNVAVTRARGALHVVGDREACLCAGAFLGKFAAAGEGGSVRPSAALFESPAEAELAGILDQLGYWYRPQFQIDSHRLDFLMVAPTGSRFDIEVDGRGHLTDKALREDEIRDAQVRAKGLRVVRIDARRVWREPEKVREHLRRLG